MVPSSRIRAAFNASLSGYPAADPSVSGINTGDEEDWVPLHSAASSGNVEIVEILLNRVSNQSICSIKRPWSNHGILTFSDQKFLIVLHAEDKTAFADVLRKISKIQKTSSGSSCVVLRERFMIWLCHPFPISHWRQRHMHLRQSEIPVETQIPNSAASVVPDASHAPIDITEETWDPARKNNRKNKHCADAVAAKTKRDNSNRDYAAHGRLRPRVSIQYRSCGTLLCYPFYFATTPMSY
ncbi:hypothetical protein T459_27197 [Capsicum annuum]|uniref:Uncharacterized protein n=1 Tax=Capsicum annuum TaxID=4072 RepID=A0A2G2YD90_CAPAN|nr:hypothetical protein T459_27197 [Capsicum annuum]